MTSDSHHLVRTLPDGPLDIVGDVHGELEALRRLLWLLGYDHHARHPEGRRLVFVGDLVDRGPQSLSTVRAVAEWVDHGRALAVLGNHDLNLLRNAERADNDWFFGRPQRVGPGRMEAPAEIAGGAERREVLAFFETLPLALERSDLRVVHAAWDDAAVAAVRGETRTMSAFERAQAAINGRFVVGEHASLGCVLTHQNENPVKLLTSGPETAAQGKSADGGPARRTERLPWWRSYERGPFCVFGHYGRPRRRTPRGLFAELDPHDATSPNSMCVDFKVGERARLLLEGRDPSVVALAALRWPEAEIVYDCGGRIALGGWRRDDLKPLEAT